MRVGHVIRIQPVGLAAEAADALHAAKEIGFNLIQRPRHFAGLGRRGAQLVQLLVNHRLQLVQRLAGPRRRDHDEVAAERLRLLERADILRDLQIVDEPAIETRVLAAGQQVRDDVERGVTRFHERRCVPGHVEARQLHAIGDRLALHAVEHRRWRRECGHGLAARNLGEPLLDELPGGVDIDVARDHQAGVVGHVIRAEEPRHVFKAGRGEILHRANRRPAVGMARRIQHRRQLDEGLAVRLVVDALALLVLHHVALTVDLVGRLVVEEEAHAIRFEKQRQIERVRRQIDVVVGAIDGGRSVVVGAGGLEPGVERAFGHVRRAFEHHVLEQMREAGAADALVTRADVIPEVQRHHRHAGIAVQDHVEAVGQRELGVRNREGRALGAEPDRRGKNQGREGDAPGHICSLAHVCAGCAHTPRGPAVGTKQAEIHRFSMARKLDTYRLCDHCPPVHRCVAAADLLLVGSSGAIVTFTAAFDS